MCDCVSMAESWSRDVYRFNLVELGQGASKVAYATPCGDHVLKLNNNGGWNQIRPEIETWENATPEQRRYLARIDAFDPVNYKWSLVERCVTVGWARQTDDERNEFYNITSELGISDLHGDNVGTTKDGRFVALDYGICDGCDRDDEDDYVYHHKTICKHCGIQSLIASYENTYNCRVCLENERNAHRRGEHRLVTPHKLCDYCHKCPQLMNCDMCGQVSLVVVFENREVQACMTGVEKEATFEVDMIGLENPRRLDWFDN